MSQRLCDRLLAALAFAVPLALYLATMAPCVGFDDQAELALCARDWSVAHPPGFPAWVALAHLWTQLFGFAGGFVAVLQAMSAVLGAGGVLLLFLAGRALLAKLAPAAPPPRRSLAAFAAALACGLGSTYWQWANAIEVYALQAFASALLLFALLRHPTARWRFELVGIAVGLGLANHHATTVLLLPVAVALVPLAGVAFADRRWLRALLAGVVVLLLAYGSMMWRAAGQHAFEFGNPDSIGRLWYHVKGGAFGSRTFLDEAEQASRVGFLLLVLLRNLWWFAVPLLLGLWLLRRRWLATACLLSPALVIALQAGRTAVANLDCYLLPSLVALALPVAFGLLPLLRWRWSPLLVALALVGMGLLDLPACNRRGFDAGDAWIGDFDRSAPQRSVVLLTRWEYRTLYRLYREQHGLRPDLVVLASDVKDTNKDLAPQHYPEFVAALQPEYQAYLDAIAAVDPDFVYSDYYRLDRESLARTYSALLQKVIAVAQREGRPLLMDLATRDFLLKGKLMQQAQVLPCGILWSIGPVADAPAPSMSGSWWHTPFLDADLCSAAVLRDYQHTLQQVAAYFEFRHDPRRDEVARLERQLREVAAEYADDKPFLGWKR